MLLQRLVEYSRRLQLPPSLYAPVQIHWLIDLRQDGVPLGMVDLREGEGKQKRGKLRPAPSLGNLRTSKIAPFLLCDNGGYVLGRVAEGKKKERVHEQHREFRKLVQKCGAELKLPEVQAVVAFYENHFSKLQIPDDYDPSENITFRVNDKWLIELPQVAQFWAKHASEAYEITGAPAECIVCGAVKPATRIHFVPTKGIPGGQSSGMSLISVNSDAYESYGLKSGFVVPLCLECSERALKALDALIRDERTHLTLGNLVYCFWTREESEFNPARLLSDPDPEAVKQLLESVQTGRPSAPLDEPDFYAVALSANSARVVVRSYLELTVPEVQRNLAQWFEWQRLVQSPQSGDQPLGVRRLAESLYREAKDVPPDVPETLMRSALTNTPLPYSLLQAAIQRNRAEQGVRYARGKLIKAVLASQDTRLKEVLTMLYQELNDPAYKCGRLLAVIERIQSVSMGSPNTTLTDRYYGSASTAPATVFGVLMRMMQPHLSKLRKQSEGLAIWLERKLYDAMPDHFPATLSLKEQGLFALGYYHQRSELFKSRSNTSEEVNTDENA